MRALTISLAFVLVAVGSAHAQDRKKAEQRYNEASKAYAAGDYEKAVKGFVEAYQIVPTNPLLFNIGQAYRLSGEKEKALSYYEKYVTFEPGGAQVPEAKEHIQKLKEEIETARRDKEAQDAERQAKERAEAEARAEAEKKRNAELAVKLRAEAKEKGKGLRLGGLVVGGVGVVALGVGVALGASDEFDGKSLALIGVGGAAVVAGGVMYFLGVKQRNDAEKAIPATALVPTVSGDSFGLAWVGSF